jgi:hypothetical protein
MKSLKIFKRLVTSILILQLLINTTLAQSQISNNVENQQTNSSNEAINNLDELLGLGNYVIYTELKPSQFPAQATLYNQMAGLYESIMKKEKLQIPEQVTSFFMKYASELRNGRVISGVLPTKKSLPLLLIGIQLSSPEVAQEFETDVKGLFQFFIEKVASAQSKVNKKHPEGPDILEFLKGLALHTKRVNNLIVMSNKEFSMADLRSQNSSTFLDEPGYKVARERLLNDGVFQYINVARLIESIPVWLEMLENLAPSKKDEKDPSGEETSSSRKPLTELIPPALLDSIIGLLKNNLPTAVAASARLEGDFLTSKALLIVGENQSVSIHPFLPTPIYGTALSPLSSKIIPADAAFVSHLSIDYIKSYDKAIDLAQSIVKLFNSGQGNVDAGDPVGMFIKEFESKENFKIRDELLASLGDELAFSFTIHDYPWLLKLPTLKKGRPTTEAEFKNKISMALLLSIKDRRKFEEVLSKIINRLSPRKANLAPGEKETDTNIVNYADFSYGFIDDFFVLADKAKTIQAMVEARDNGNSLLNNQSYRSAMGQHISQPTLASFYASSDVMANLIKFLRDSPVSTLTPKKQEILRPLLASINDMKPEPFVSTASPDPLGAYYELKFPTNIYTLMLAYITTIEPNVSAKSQRQVTPKRSAKKRPIRRRVR